MFRPRFFILIHWLLHRRSLISPLISVLLLLLFSAGAFAQWQNGGIPICTADRDQLELASAKDGLGGFLLAWADRRSGVALDQDIYVQRVNAYGYPVWPDANGLAVATNGDQASHPGVCPDGSGGAWVVWASNDGSTWFIYGKHIDTDGNTVWGGTNGVIIASDPTYSFHTPVCDADGLGGMIVVWHHSTSSADSLVAQKVDASGGFSWTAGGVLVGDYTNGSDVQVLGRADAGAFVVWNRGIEVLAQRLSSSGSLLWNPDGVHPYSSAASESSPRAALDGNGGVIITWLAENLIEHDIRVFAQRLDPGGNSMFFANPWPPAEAVLWVSEFYDIDAGSLDICSDGNGGAIVSWDTYNDFVGYPEYKAIYANRVSPTGGKLWGSDPIQVSADDTNQSNVHITENGDGAVVVWDSHAQRLSLAGARLWGNEFSDLSIPAIDPKSTVEGNNGQTFVGWIKALTANDDVYATSLASDGLIPQPNLTLTLLSYPADTLSVGDLVQPAIEVSNTGNIDSGSFLLAYYADLVTPPTGSGGATSTESANNLAPGERFQWSPSALTASISGTWHSYAFADPDASITEANESDNILGPVDLVWIDQPDLEITSFTVSNPNPHNGEHVTATITVHNRGTWIAGPFDIDYYLNLSSPPGEGQSGFLTHRMIGVGAGAYFTWTTPLFTHTTNIVATTHGYAQVDTQNEVIESDEDNNVAGPVDIHWQYGPDLDITSFTVSNFQPEVGEEITATITVKNNGYLAVPSCRVDFYQNSPDEPTVGDTGDLTTTTPSLDPGESYQWITDPFTCTDDITEWWCRAQVDPLDEIGEYDEDNNTAGPLGVVWNTPTQEGWPVTLGGTPTSPVIAALHTSPPSLRAVIAGSSDGKCYAFNGAGQSLPGWPYMTTGSIEAPPAVGDIDGDGNREVVIATVGGSVTCVKSLGMLEMPMWTYDTAKTLKATPVLADMDGDGDLETVIAAGDGTVYLLSSTGSVETGWPVDVGDTLSASPAVADLDLDGTPEIIAVGNNKKIGSSLHVLRPDGSSYSGQWPVHYSAIEYSPVVGDVLGDSRLEIVFTDEFGYVHAVQVNPSDPSMNLALPQPVHSSPALVDLDGNDGGKVEIVLATEYTVGSPPLDHLQSNVYVIEGDGTVPNGWPVTMVSHGNVQAGAAPVTWGSGVNTMIALGSYNHQCWVYNYKGQRPYGYTMPAAGSITQSLAVGELDADSHMEVIVPGGNQLACYDLLAGSYSPDRLSWPMWGHDMYRTRCFGHGTVTAVEPLPQVPLVSQATLYAPHPNPFNPTVVLSYATTHAGRVELTIYDLAGRRIRGLIRENLLAGFYETSWNGRDDAGKAVGSGVYFVHLKSSGQTDSRRITMVK